MEERNNMTKFVNDKCEELKVKMKEKVLAFETELEEYKNALLQLKGMSQCSARNGNVDKQLDSLKQRYRQFSKDIRIEVKFERNLSLHFLQSVGYVTEVGPSNIKKDDPKTDEVSREINPVTLDSYNTEDSSDKSSTNQESSFLQINWVPDPSDTDGAITDDNDFQGEVNDNTEAGACTIEQAVSKQIPALKQLTLIKDIIVLPEQKLACICESTLKIIETENFATISSVPLKNEKYNKLVLLNETSVVAISPDLQPVVSVSLNDLKTVQYEWVCECHKCTMVSHQNNLCILCIGAHLHVYRLDRGKQDMYKLDVPVDVWRPKCAILNKMGTELFVSDVDTVYCFKCFDNNFVGQRLYDQWKYFDDDSFIDRKLYIGISMLDENVVLLDKNNNSILKLSSEGGFYRGTIESSSFSDCDLVAFDRQESLVHLISYRYNEYKRVKLLSSLSVGVRKETFDPYVSAT